MDAPDSRKSLRHYGHSREGAPKQEWQLLEEHLEGVAALAGGFLGACECQKWGEVAGRWHDLGKYSAEFQRRIGAEESPQVETRAGTVDHSTAGAQHARKCLGEIGLPLAYAIAGHHAGLANWNDATDSHLRERLQRDTPDWSAAPEDITAAPQITPNDFPFTPHPVRLGVQVFLFTKMLFSALVDADFLNTEAFLDSRRAEQRKYAWSLEEMRNRFDRFIKQLTEDAARRVSNDASIGSVRASVLTAARAAAGGAIGMYRFTVPTGGGKTLSSMAFGLDHALCNGLSRIIYVIPYTSIIEQNVAVFRSVFGEIDGVSPVLEHHSNFDPGGEYEWSRLASENWDAPLVVTTNVQFFESIFDHRVSRNRKLHRIANSVIILDEAQAFPPGMLKPTLRAMEELQQTYRSTFVFCTATQPAITWRDDFRQGIQNVREIAPNVPQLFSALKRTEVTFSGPMKDTEIVTDLLDHNQVLVVVNTRDHARVLYESIASHDVDGAFHLSARMYPVHRTRVLRAIKERLAAGEPVRLISTQLIEAGVDIDFPAVFRAISGIDSIAQAAGRCNREGRSTTPRSTVVFDPVDAVAPRAFQRQIEIARAVLGRFDDPLLPEAIEAYFRELYWRQSGNDKLDTKGIIERMLRPERAAQFDIPFREISDAYHVIDSATHSIIIHRDTDDFDYGRVTNLVERLTRAVSGKEILRQLQRYSIQVYENTFRSLIADGAITEVRPGVYVLNNPQAYDTNIGLIEDRAAVRNPSQTMV